MYSLKEGSRHEHLGLAVHIWGVLEKLISLKVDIGTTVEALYHFEEDILAAKLIKTLDSVLAQGENAIKIVWTTEVAPNGILQYDLLGELEWRL